MAFKSLEDTFVYRNLNKEGAITSNVSKILTKGEQVGKENLEEAFMIINKNFKFPLKYKIFEEIQNKEIIMIHSPTKTKLPTSLPFFLTKNSSGKVVAIVPIDTYGIMNHETKNISIDPKKFYCILEGAYFAKLYYEFAIQVRTRNAVITNGSAIYSNMFTRVLNKKYALNVDKSKMHKVLFLSSKFYLINILGANDNEMTSNYAMKNCPNGNPYTIKEVNELVPTEAYKDLSTFITALSKTETGLGFADLTVRSYLESFINMYDGSALLALESLPYFLYNVFAVTNGAYLNNQYILEDIVEGHGAKIYADLINLDK